MVFYFCWKILLLLRVDKKELIGIGIEVKQIKQGLVAFKAMIKLEIKIIKDE